MHTALLAPSVPAAFAALLLTVAGYCVVRAVRGLRRRRGGLELDVSHVLMGAGMSGMLLGSVDSGITTVLFAGTAVWFAGRTAMIFIESGGRTVLDSQQPQHFLLAGAMVLVAVLAGSPATSPMPDLPMSGASMSAASMSGTTAISGITVLAAACVLVAFAHTVWTTRRPHSTCGPAGPLAFGCSLTMCAATGYMIVFMPY